MRKIYPCFSILILSLLSGCIKAGGECEEPLMVENSSIVVDFKDSTGKYLYSQLSPTYDKDSLKVLDESNGKLIRILSSLNNIPNTPSGYWRIDIGPLYDPQTNANSFNTEVCKNFILRYRANEFDTLKTCFRPKKTKCGSVFEILNVYYKGQLIATRNNDTGTEVIVVKR